MKKIIAGALVATGLGQLPGVAHAQVEIYGAVDNSFVMIDNGKGVERKIQSGTAVGSRWGFRGVEDMGGGLKAHFNLEGGIFSDTGAMTGAGGFSRRSFVGLSHPSWGKVDLGRDYNPLFLVLTRMDPMRAGTLSASVGFMAVGAGQSANSIHYTTPNMKGVTAKFMYAMGESATEPKDGGNRYSFNTYYESGPFLGVVADYRAKTVLPNATRSILDHQSLVGASYDFKWAKFTAVHEVGHNHSGVATINFNNGVAYSADYTTSLVGVTVPVSQHRLAATYQMYNDKTATDRDSSNLGLAGFYVLSKRTELYANVSKIFNQNGQRFGFVDAGRNAYNYTPAPGQRVNPVGMAVGITHWF
jgi:predicted porin